ncbi:MAG TPA: hypothetical protein VD735_03690 [Candidatus Saccharimonadales bacterium]|nr:hypothetical protein [Candidatus Saccharimonadales bacterium]
MDKRYETIMGHGAAETAMPRFEPLGALGVRPVTQQAEELRSPYIGPYTQTLGSMMISQEGIDRATLGFTKYTVDADEKDRPFLFVAGGGGPLFTSMLTNVALLGPKSVMHYANKDSFQLGAGARDNPNTVLNSADVMFLEAAGTGFQEGVARSAVMPGTDPKHFYGVTRDAASMTAAIHNTIITDRLEGRPIVLAAPSYAAGFRLPQIATNLMTYGIDVQGLISLNGHYDYAMQDYHKKDDPRPFVAAFPTMAMANAYYNGQLNPDCGELPCIKEYERIAEWSQERYRAALERPHDTVLRAKVASEMAKLILPNSEIGSSLTLDYLMNHDLYIDPVTFTSNYFPDRQMSLIDSRYVYPEFSDDPHDYAIIQDENGISLEPLYYDRDDTAVDVAFARLLPEYLNYYREFLGQEGADFKAHQPAYAQWPFTGIWERRRSHEAMARMLTLNPNMHILHVAGIYDQICPPERARMFWDEMKSLTNVEVEHREPFAKPLVAEYPKRRGRPTVDIRKYVMSHLLGGIAGSTIAVSADINQFMRNLPT